jgi:hypothetical protein
MVIKLDKEPESSHRQLEERMTPETAIGLSLCHTEDRLAVEVIVVGLMAVCASILKQELAGDVEQSVMGEHSLSGRKNIRTVRSPVATVDPRQLLEDSFVFTNYQVRHHYYPRLHQYFEAKRVTSHADAARSVAQA